jgi:hypothetical protein
MNIGTTRLASPFTSCLPVLRIQYDSIMLLQCEYEGTLNPVVLRIGESLQKYPIGDCTHDGRREFSLVSES